MNTNKHENWQALEPANFELSELYHRDVQSLNNFPQLNFNVSIRLVPGKQFLSSFFWISCSVVSQILDLLPGLEH